MWNFAPALPPWNPFGAVNSSLFRGFHRVLNSLKGSELDIVELAVDLLDLADINILDDVPRLRIDRYRPARALPFHAFHSAHERVAVGSAIGLLEGLIPRAQRPATDPPAMAPEDRRRARLFDR